MFININGQEVELKYSFNSFKYMEELDLGALAVMESKPFKIVPVVRLLLLGALNYNAKVKYPMNVVDDFIEDFIVEGSLGELLEDLMKLLEASYFFKSLQKKTKVEVE